MANLKYFLKISIIILSLASCWSTVVYGVDKCFTKSLMKELPADLSFSYFGYETQGEDIRVLFVVEKNGQFITVNKILSGEHYDDDLNDLRDDLENLTSSKLSLSMKIVDFIFGSAIRDERCLGAYQDSDGRLINGAISFSYSESGIEVSYSKREHYTEGQALTGGTIGCLYDFNKYQFVKNIPIL